MNDQDFWKDQNRAKSISRKCENLRTEVLQWQKIQKDVNDLLEISILLTKEPDATVEKDLNEKLKNLKKEFADLEFYILFSGKYDKNDTIVAIHSGTGGVEAQDWALMLSRMLLRYCEKIGFDTKIIDENKGQEAGIKSLTFIVYGSYAYGYLKSESGVHRLVRISPFDAEKMRHTSFALIEVLPLLQESGDVVIKEDDLKIDAFRSSGHGGQSVNKTDSAVRITHIPTGIVVKCQNERSQHQNKEMAMHYLKAKLLKLQEFAREKEKSKIRGEYQAAEWGNQIRSYVLQPYKMVKDHRTEYEEHDPQSVLDGNLERFVESYLRWINKKSEARKPKSETNSNSEI